MKNIQQTKFVIVWGGGGGGGGGGNFPPKGPEKTLHALYFTLYCLLTDTLYTYSSRDSLIMT